MKEQTMKMLHRAASLIEMDGTGGYQVAVTLVGEDAARALLIANLRRDFKSNETYPPHPEIVDQVNQVLAGAGIMQ